MTASRQPDPLTRIDDAHVEIGSTDVERGVAVALTLVFLLMVSLPAAIQLTADDGFSSFEPRATGGRGGVEGTPTGLVSRVLETNRRVLARATGVSDAIGEESVLVQTLRPLVQQVVTGALGGGTELVFTGDDSWLFYGPDVRYVTDRPFLSPRQLERRAASGDTLVRPPTPDPRPAIIELERQLAARDIRLVVMPTPVKPAVEPHRLGRPTRGTPLDNASYPALVAELRQRDILVFDVAEILRQERSASDDPLYLATDTHWRPETVEQVASRLAGFLAEHVPLPTRAAPGYSSTREAVTNVGDTVRLLDLPAHQRLFPPEDVRLRRVTEGGERWRPDAAADVLILGDSFTNIYSVAAMGWGESAGLAEQLSYALDRPVDRLSQNDGGAHTSRELLATELRRGRDRLQGKRVVIYQFSSRELAFGDWRLVDLETPARPATATFLRPAVGGRLEVEGTVSEIGPIPTPGTVPYKDQIVAIHLTEVTGGGVTLAPGATEALVYVWGMRDDVLTSAADRRIGDAVRLQIEPWSAVADELDGINRGEVSSLRAQLAEPWWGELVEEGP